ncbi:sensor histidine kinase [Paenibacillus senegalensis]|uniref:sensor histidine kinase n=1 Tax=Paenibacillus senegalensis TaxID=1465766 RepID=UPI0002FBDC11|nr:sensor histidine kinase [Paenibacillus senegalensis]
MIEKHKWHWSEWILLALYGGWAVLVILYYTLYGEASLPLSPAQTFFLLGVIYMLPVIAWRPGWVHPVIFPLLILLAIGPAQVYFAYHLEEQTGLLLVPLIIAGFLSRWTTIWWTVPAFLILPTITYLLPIGQGVRLPLFFSELIFSCFSFLIGLGIQRVLHSHLRMKKLYEENLKQYDLIRQQKNVLEQYAEQVENLTLLEERNRLARELHDTVGHTFTSVIMGMDAVSYLVHSHPDKAVEKLEVLRKVTREGLDEIRRSIHQIAPLDERLGLTTQISRLAHEFAAHTGTQVKVETLGEEQELPLQLKLTLVRCVQESLTNAKRHGGAPFIQIKIEFYSDHIKLVIKDNGVGTDNIKLGFGLTSMKERLAAWRGDLSIHSTPDLGTTITCTVSYTTASSSSKGLGGG